MDPGRDPRGDRDGDDGGRELTEAERVEREEFARGHIGAGEEPVEPRPAATMVLARAAEPPDGRGGEGDRELGSDGDGGRAGDHRQGAAGAEGSGLQLLFLRRPDDATFAAGAYVFPGGVMDPEDEATGLGDRFGPHVTPAERSALVSALREGFEETGLLPADDLPGAERRARAREALLRGEVDFPEVVRELDLTFQGLRAAYFARWITPARLSRRYDARFFLVEHRGGEPRLLHDEHTEAAWLDPAVALRRFEAGDMPLLYPTRKTVEELAGFRGLPDAFRSYRERRVRPVRPRLLVEGEAVIPVLPGDPRYEEAGLEAGDG